MRNVLKLFIASVTILLTFAACRGDEKDQPAGNKIQGEWTLQGTVQGRSVIYNFRSSNDVVITDTGVNSSTNTLPYSVVYENYKDPNSPDQKQDIVYIGNLKYALGFSSSNHMILTNYNVNPANKLEFERRR